LQYSSSLTTLIEKSAEGAAGQCSGGKNGTTCGANWSTTKWDGTQSLGQDLSALEMILAAMPSSGVRTDNSTGTTGHSNGSETSTGASPTNTNDARRQQVSMNVLVATIAFAYFVSL
jgi:mannan endo-1,6-alpha-mannosidase